MSYHQDRNNFILSLDPSLRPSPARASADQGQQTGGPDRGQSRWRSSLRRTAMQLGLHSRSPAPNQRPGAGVAGPDVSLRVRNTNLPLTLQAGRWPGELEALATGTGDLCCGVYIEGSGRQTIYRYAMIQMSKRLIVLTRSNFQLIKFVTLHAAGFR